MTDAGSPIDSGSLLQTLGAYADNGPDVVQAQLVNQTTITSGKRVGQLALFEADGSPFLPPTNVAALPSSVSITPASDKLICLQGGVSTITTVENLTQNLSKIVSSGANNGVYVQGTTDTQGDFSVASTAFGTIMSIKTNAADSQPGTILSSRTIQLGLGGSTAADWKLKHVSAGQANVEGHLGFDNGYNVILGTGTGTKIGTSSTQKLGVWGATPNVRPTGWGAATGTATRTTFVTSTVTTAQLAERVKALIDDLIRIGLIGV